MGKIPEWANGIINEAYNKRLSNLDLDGHGRTQKLTRIPANVYEMAWLKKLNLGGNQVSTIPDEISKLYNLQTLDLHSNQLERLPKALLQLGSLQTLYLHDNLITSLPDWIVDLPNLKRLQLFNNPISFPPPEIIDRGFLFSPVDLDRLRGYFNQLKKMGEGTRYEAKLIIVGEPGAGKTSLVKKLLDPGIALDPDAPPTKGIEITNWGFSFLSSNKVEEKNSPSHYKINIWDFGGQEIYYSTHQFFLTRHSLYVLVADAREQKTDFFYWLNLINSLGHNSPVLIVSNEKHDRSWAFNKTKLREQFENLKEIFSVNLSQSDKNLLQLTNAIKYHIVNLPHIRQSLPHTWIRVRQSLENDSRQIMPLNEYLELCHQNGLERYDDKMSLSEYLHDLGVCLHFQDEPLLKNILILKPEWATTATYYVLDNPEIIARHGRFNKSDLKTIWKDEQFAPWRDELLQLMIRFRVCYPINDSGSLSDESRYLAPQLLSGNQPHFHWKDKNNLILKYVYPHFIPKGIFTRFIVTMHDLITNQDLVWKSGMVLEQKRTQALIIEDTNLRQIIIRVAGQQKRDLLTKINWEFEKIHAYLPRLDYRQLIPCNCKRCQGHPNPFLFDFERLKKRLAAGKKTVECDESYEEVLVLSLMDDVGIERQNVANNDFSSSIDLSSIRKKIVQFFIEEEVKTLCFDLGVDYNSLPAQGYEYKVRELVARIERTGRLEELIQHLRQKRPNISWP